MIDVIKLKQAIEVKYKSEATWTNKLIRLQEDTGLYVPNIQRILRVKNCSIANLISICKALDISIDSIIRKG